MDRTNAVLCANASWIIPLVVFGANGVSKVPPTGDADFEKGRALGHACVFVCAYVVGFVLAVIALRSVKEFGPEKIRIPAWIGLCLNALPFVGFVVVLFLPRGQ